MDYTKSLLSYLKSLLNNLLDAFCLIKKRRKMQQSKEEHTKTKMKRNME